MSTYEIRRERIPSTDPRLKRNIHHDDRSRLYPYPTEGLSIATVEHPRTLPILDQGQAGACTADAGEGTLGTAPFSGDQATGTAWTRAFGTWDQSGAYRLYDAEERLDGDGPYPPNDNGSTGLTCAKVLKAAAIIAGYQHTFSLDDALKALTVLPLITGLNWYNSMFDPSPEGIVTVSPSSGLAGGHEISVVGYDDGRGLVHLANSWGPSWGQQGYFWLAAEDWGKLLQRQGDVTVFTPLTQPAPTPTPPSDADGVLADAARPWVAQRHCGSNARMATALRTWLTQTGR